MANLNLNKRIRHLRHTLLAKTLDKYVIWRNKHINLKDTFLDLPSHSVKENKRIWDNYDWPLNGEEWTLEVKNLRGLEPNIWKASLIDEMILKYIVKDSIILEIGPGAGRWSETLQKLASKLILADISQRCLNLCKKRFKNCKNVEYRLIKRKLDFISNNSIDYIWSYDVFVHINPTDIEGYIIDFERILRPGGYAIIHHSGEYSSEKDARGRGFRSYMNADLFAHIVKKSKMEIIRQDYSSVHLPGDVISVFLKPIIAK